jgi:hypothetical protein
MRRALLTFGFATALAALLGGAREATAEPVAVDRVAVRFTAPELGGARSPRFVFERVLAFEARVAALEAGERGGYRERHVTAALERHIAETLLASLRIEPEVAPDLVTRQAGLARRRLEERVGGASELASAARAEGISERELLGLFRRQARASLYLDRMVAPMLEPSNAELSALHRSGRTPFSGAPFESVQPGLKRWFVATRLAEALQSYYQNARSRLDIVILSLPTQGE